LDNESSGRTHIGGSKETKGNPSDSKEMPRERVVAGVKFVHGYIRNRGREALDVKHVDVTGI